jgi:hypothetical protein
MMKCYVTRCSNPVVGSLRFSDKRGKVYYYCKRHLVRVVYLVRSEGSYRIVDMKLLDSCAGILVL